MISQLHSFKVEGPGLGGTVLISAIFPTPWVGLSILPLRNMSANTIIGLL